MPRSLNRGSHLSGKVAGVVIPVIVLLFAGGIVVARMVAPADAPASIVAETPIVTETTVTEPTTEPTETTPTPFVPLAALPSRKLDNVDLTKAETVTVTSVVDGDTFMIQSDDGSGPDLLDVTVRMYGVDAPEAFPEAQKEPCGPEATEQLRAILKPGTEVLLLPDKRDEDRFGRLLRYVFLPDGSSVDAGMIVAGLANAWTSDGTHKDELKKMETDATLHLRGCLWANG